MDPLAAVQLGNITIRNLLLSRDRCSPANGHSMAARPQHLLLWFSWSAYYDQVIKNRIRSLSPVPIKRVAAADEAAVPFAAGEAKGDEDDREHGGEHDVRELFGRGGDDAEQADAVGAACGAEHFGPNGKPPPAR